MSSCCCWGQAEAWLLRDPQGAGTLGRRDLRCWGLQTAGAPGSQFQGLPTGEVRAAREGMKGQLLVFWASGGVNPTP